MQQEVQEGDNLLASHNLLYLLKNIRLRGKEHTVTRLCDKLLPSLSAGTFQSHSLTFKVHRGQVLLMCFHCVVSSERKVHAVTKMGDESFSTNWPRQDILQYNKTMQYCNNYTIMLLMASSPLAC